MGQDNAFREENVAASPLQFKYSLSQVSSIHTQRPVLIVPGILYLDEPTSGLDSFTANRLIKTLLSIAHEQNRIVVCTIHQPRTEMLNLFDKSLLLSKGRMVYFGASREMVPYFSELGYRCPLHVNPADYLCRLLSLLEVQVTYNPGFELSGPDIDRSSQ